MKTRIERDTFGPVEVPDQRLWGAQTQRSLQNFDISGERQPREIIRALVQIKRCAAVAAVTSTDLVNVAVGLASSDLAPRTPLVLRLGDGEVAAETDSLLHLGRICDAHKIAADTMVRGLQGLQSDVIAPL